MEILTTYTVKAKNANNVWVFKYHLNGTLHSFLVLDGILTPKQVKWLFEAGNFPHCQEAMQVLATKFKPHFDISIGLPDVTFEAFWEAYEQKTKKTRSQQLWKKLKDADRIKALEGIRRYNNYLRARNGIAKMNPDTYLHQQRWEDEF